MKAPSTYRLTRELLLNDLAVRCFRDIGDQDYIAARLAYHHRLPEPSLWQSQQTLEKYLKCILLLHRIPATDVRHSITAAIRRIESSGAFRLNLTPATQYFVDHVEAFGTERYLTTSTFAIGRHVVNLDRAVWELRRFCTLDPSPRTLKLEKGKRATRYSIEGWLERVLSKKGETRTALIKENGFWGPGRKTVVRTPGWLSVSNAPLWMHPEILGLATKYIYIPHELRTAYENHNTPYQYVPEDGIDA